MLEASRRIEQPQNLLVRELHHRVKNTLATVQALVGASGRSTGSFEGFYRSFSNRIASLARSHNLLTGDYWQTASLREIAPIPIGTPSPRSKPTCAGPRPDRSARTGERSVTSAICLSHMSVGASSGPPDMRLFSRPML